MLLQTVPNSQMYKMLKTRKKWGGSKNLQILHVCSPREGQCSNEGSVELLTELWAHLGHSHGTGTATLILNLCKLLWHHFSVSAALDRCKVWILQL